MSLPPELRVLCYQLSSTTPTELPSRLPTLLHYVFRCQTPLSTSAEVGNKLDSAGSSVSVHKLKTQLTTLLNGKSSEERLAAAVLIKAVVEVGGWEILRGSEPWVRGLLSVLGVSPIFFFSISRLTILLETRNRYCQRNMPYDFDQSVLHDPSISNAAA